VAIVLVVAFHAGLAVPGGFVGVDMFFVISGYVIAAMLLRRGGPSGSVGFADFYTRRARRLMPAFALLGVVVAVASMAVLGPLGPQQATAKTGSAASILVANVQLSRVGVAGYFGLAAEANAMLHTWSLSVEEQVYLVFPAFLLVAWRLARRFPIRRSSRATLFALVSVATGASFVLSLLTSYHGGARRQEKSAEQAKVPSGVIISIRCTSSGCTPSRPYPA